MTNYCDIQEELSSIIRLLCLFESDIGSELYIGEPVSILEHSLQAAYEAIKFFMTKSSDANSIDNGIISSCTSISCLSLSHQQEEVVISSLFHDIGHLIGLEAGDSNDRMGGCGIMNHEGIGGEFVSKLGFSDRIAKLVANHVMAKRYLCFKSPDYYSILSDASKTTLRYQGGPLTEETAQEFENDPDFDVILAMRKFDEAAKVPGADVPNFHFYVSLLKKHCQSSLDSKKEYLLSPSQVAFYQENQYLKIPNLLKFHNIDVDDLSNWIDDISKWDPKSNDWIIQFEESVDNHMGSTKRKQLARAENFVNFHADMNRLNVDIISKVVSTLFGEQAVLFKEKINFKLPGGGGFLCHQDTVAYIGLAERHISVMVAIDAATEENGCLLIAPGQWKKDDLPLTAQGTVTSEAEATLDFIPITTTPSDVFIFSGYLPHKSGKNMSSRPRRAMFLTYNPKSEGDHHTEYYRAKHEGKEGFAKEGQLSFITDFTGKIVE